MTESKSFLDEILLNPWWLALASGLIATPLFGLWRLRLRGRMGQPIREDGPQHHKKKGVVPTGTGIIMAVLLFFAGVLVLPHTSLEVPASQLGIYVCWAAALMGLLGFVDDQLKVRRGSEGLKARYKLPVQIVVGLGLLYFLQSYFDMLAQQSPMEQPWPVTAPLWLFYPLGLFIWLGALNGANFTDGADGLLSSTTLVVLAGAFYALLDGVEPLSVPVAVGFGVLTAFLIYNWKPALIYMGDAGSLAVGALVAGLFLAKGWWLFLGLCAFVWVINVLSVVLQVGSVRLTGKRVFLMSPLHHHFELAGWGERTTVLVFTALQLLGCIVAFAWLRLGTHWGLCGTTMLLGILALLLLRFHKKVR